MTHCANFCYDQHCFCVPIDNFKEPIEFSQLKQTILPSQKKLNAFLWTSDSVYVYLLFYQSDNQEHTYQGSPWMAESISNVYDIPMAKNRYKYKKNL